MRGTACIRRIAGICSFLGVIGIGATLSRGQAEAPNAGRRIVEERCSVCHDLSRVERLYGIHDRRSWEEVVSRMVRLGASLDGPEHAVAVDYLNSQSKAVNQ